MSWKGQSWGAAEQWGNTGKSWGKDAGGKGGKSWGKDGGKGAAAANPQVVKPPPGASWGAGAAQSWEPAWKKQATEQAWGQQQSWGKAAGKGDAKGDAKGWGKGAAKGEPTQTPEQVKEKVTKLTTDLSCAETVVNSTLEASKVVEANEKATAQALKSSLESVEKQHTKLRDIEATLTKECTEARKVGAPAFGPTQELQKLLIKCKSLAQSLGIQMNKLKPKVAKAANEAELKAKEAKDVAAFRPLLTKAKADVLAAEKAVAAVSAQANPVVATPPEAGEALDKKIEAIQTAAVEGLKKVEAARTELNEKFKAIQVFAPEAKKSSNEALMELQKKLTDNAKACNVYKNFKKELPKLVESQKAVAEVEEKLKGHEASIAKAAAQSVGGKLTKAQSDTIDEILDPVQKAINSAVGTMNSKGRQADSVTQLTFEKLRTRSDDLKKKIEAVLTKIKPQRDVIKAEEAITVAKERLEKAEEAWKGCQDAEMPFLTGVEVLPEDTMNEALKACGDASTTMIQAVSACRSWVQNRLKDCRSYEKDLGASTSEALNPLLAKIVALDGKGSAFKQEMNDRRVTSIMVEVFDNVKAFEKKVKAAEIVGKALASTTLEDDSTDAITDAIEKTKAACNEASTGAAEAKKLLSAKEKEAKLGRSNAALTKINDGLNSGNDKLSKLRNSIRGADSLLKARAAVQAGEEKVKEAETDAKKCQKLAPAEGKKFTMEKVTAFDEACAAALKTIQAAQSLVQPHMKDAAPKAKASLQALLDRKTAAKTALDKAQADAKEKREDTIGDHIIAEAETTIKAAEAAAAKMEEVEGPFLTGAQLKLKATQELLAKCEEAGTNAQNAISAAKKYTEQKTKESMRFGDAAKAKVKESFAEKEERVKKASARLATFNKDNKDREKESKMVEAAEKTDELDAAVKKTLALIAPFEKEGAENMSEAEAAKPLQAFLDVDKETQKSISAQRRFLGDREKEQKGNKDHTEALKKLNERVSASVKELVEKKKAIAPHEQKALGTKLLAEVKAAVDALPATVQKAKEGCAELLEKGGADFLVSASVRTLVSALQAHMKAKELDEAALYKAAGNGKKIKESDFVKYLKALPEEISRDELNAFTDERRAAMFKKISADGKTLTQEDFSAMLKPKYVCIKSTVLTNQAKVDGSETLCKVEPETFLYLIGKPQDEANGLTRSECTVDGKTGWVTLRQGQGGGRHGGGKGGSKGHGKGGGNSFVVQVNPIKQFCHHAEKAMSASNAGVQSASQLLQANMKKGGEAKEGSRLKEARDEMAKLKEPVTNAQKEMDELKAKFNKARKEYDVKEGSEKNAHIEARNAKEAAQYIDGPKAKVEALEAEAKAVEEAAAPMATVTGDELTAFATPAGVLENVEKLAAIVTKNATAARELVKEQAKAANDASPQNGGTAEAKKQLKNMQNKLDEFSRKSSKNLAMVRGKCKTLVDAKFEAGADAIRKHAQEKKMTPEALFDSLKKGDKIPEQAFCKLLQSFEGLSMAPDHAKLVARKLEVDGLSKDAFLKYIVIYYKIVKTIAFTDNFDISKCKTLRKGEEGEVVEVLEGPMTDEESQMTRVRGRSTIEGKVTEGWITVGGSKGTCFMEKTTRPKPTVAEKKAP